MGLDMFCYAVRRATDDEVAAFNEYESCNTISYIHAEDCDCESMEDLAPYMRRVSRVGLVTDFEAIESEMRESYRLLYGDDIPSIISTSYSNGTVSYRFHDKPPISFDIERYTHEDMVDYCVFHSEEIGYWRKNYDLEQKIYLMYADAHGKTVENCGYHRIDDIEGAIEEMFGDDDRPYIPYPKEGWAFFYHEWY